MIPDGWMICTYGDAANINPSLLASSTSDDLVVEYLDIGAVSASGRIGRTKSFRFREAPSRARRTVQANDIIVSTVRPYLRAFALLSNPKPNTVVSTGFAVLRSKDGIDPQFLYQTVLREDFVAFLVNRQTGSNYPAVGAKDVAAASLLVPPLGEQRKIAAILSSVDEAIAKTEAIIEQLLVVKKAMMQELLTRGLPGRHTRFKQTEIGEIPEPWVLTELNSLIQPDRPVCYGILKPGKTVPGGIPVIKVKNIRQGRIVQTALLLTDPRIDQQYLRSKLREGDILLSIRGTSGRVAIVPKSLNNANITQDTARLSIRDGVDSAYVYFALQSHELQRQVAEQTRGQAVKGINIRDVRRLKVPLPSLPEQGALARLFSAHQEHLEATLSSLKELRATKQALMSVLLTGEVRVTPDEETP